MKNRRSSGLHWIRVMCFVAVTLPNCTRCCPIGSCAWAWEQCPASSGSASGCGSCSSSNNSATGCNGASPENPTMVGLHDASASFQSTPDATVYDADRGGTLAFVTAESSAFVVAAIGANDEVKAFRVEANALDDDPLTVRPAGALELDGEPGRVLGDGRGHALVALRGAGAVASIDPLALAVTSRRTVCRRPNALAIRDDVTYVGCQSGEVVSVRMSDGAEIERVLLGADVRELATARDALIASAGTTLFTIDADAGVSKRETRDVIGPMRGSSDDVVIAIERELGSLEPDGFRARTRAAASISDVSVLGDAMALVADGEAWLRASADGDLVRVGGGLAARALALGDVPGEVTRRVLVVQTVKPRMLVFFTVPGVPSAAAIEPLE